MEHLENVETARGRFGCLVEGEPSAPLALFLHGFPDSADSFRPLLAQAAARGYRAVAPFLRGYAPSVLEGPYDHDALASDVIALADALGAPTFSLAGHDWGALIGYVVAARETGALTHDATQATSRVTSLVTMSVPHPVAFLEDLGKSRAQLSRSWYMGFFQLPGLAERVVPRDHFAFLDRLFREWSPGLRPDPEALERVKAAIAPGFPAAIEYYRAFARPLRDALARLRAVAGHPILTPTLHLTGAADGCIGPDIGRGQRRFFHGPFASEVLPGLGHFLHWESPLTIGERVLSWFDAFRTPLKTSESSR
jgi:pimeloyl-ACP methyl ester carboxylesterase